MPNTEQKITKLVDGVAPSIEATVRQVGGEGALLTDISGSVNITGTVDLNNQPIITSDDTVLLLRRLIKVLESSATVDYANRQKITVEVMPTVAVTMTNTAVTTIGGLDQRWQYIDTARIAYNTMRSNLIFS